LRLTTGRLRDQWHAMSRTGNVASLFAHAPEPRLALHPADLERYGLGEGALVRAASRRGELYVMVEADEGLRPGLAYLPMHWGARFLGGRGMRGVNELTLPALDPTSKQPELKHCAIRVERADLAWRLVAFGRAADATAQELFERLEPFMREFPFVSRTLAGDERPGVLLRIAAREMPDKEALARIDRAFGLGSADALRYDDASRSIGRRVALASDGRSSAIRAVRLSGDVRSERWLHDYWRRGAAVEGVRRFLAVPLASPPGVAAPLSRVLCVCHGVTEDVVRHALVTLPKQLPDALGALQARLKCGTECGSCIPELRGLIARSLSA
jgi:assimilatory nitrate reductase catalytic subunit